MTLLEILNAGGLLEMSDDQRKAMFAKHSISRTVRKPGGRILTYKENVIIKKPNKFSKSKVVQQYDIKKS